jgi:pantoate--beta-alanine ligase
MNIVTEIKEWQRLREKLGAQSIGFVPTMGNLHIGHLNLCKRAKDENDIAVVSIFVNPTQFNQQNDFANYPRTLEMDIELLQKNKVDYLFLPNAAEMYPDDYQIQLTETFVSQELEGEHRPGHFNGMLTVVLKLLNLIRATHAYFGEKDYQQLLLVKKMASALFLPTKIIGCETIREEDGLACSSRNTRLSDNQRVHAAHFPRLLHSQLDLEVIVQKLNDFGFKVDYVAEKWGRRLGAVWLNEVRLIDNINLIEER